MKKRLISMVLALMMILSACAFTLTGCSDPEEAEGETTTSKTNVATTLVMWCVTEEGTDEAQAKAVAEKMSEYTKSKFKAKLIVKYFTLEEYFDALEEAITKQEEAKKAADEAAAKAKELEKAYKKMSKEEKAAYDAEQAKIKEAEEEEKKRLEEEQEKIEEDDEIRYDENGKPIIDKTVYPEVEDYQVDILYLSGYEKYKDYIEKKWLSALNSEMSSGSAKKIPNYVPASLLNAVKYNGTTYAIPNNNVIGEYTYMMINKELYDKYYYTGYLDNVHSVIDLKDFLEDIAAYEPDVLPIDGEVDYCLSLIADYWDIDPTTLNVTGNFSILGYARKNTDKINRGEIAFKFNNLMTDKTYQEALMNLMEFKFNGYFGKAEEGQTSAVKFVTGDAALAAEYEDEYYPVPVDYPRAADEDIYQNMFAISAFTSSLSKSMEVIALLNTDEEFRNIFQYGIEGTNYTKNSDGSVSMKASNAYNMDLSKTGNEFIAYVPKGTNIQVWEYAKQQNRDSLVSPLLGFDFNMELIDQTELFEDEEAKFQEKYSVEKIDTELIQYVSEKSRDVWSRIEACKNAKELEKLIETLSKELSTGKDEKLKKATTYKIVEPEFEITTEHIAVPKTDADGNLTVTDATITAKASVRTKKVTEKVEGEEVENEKECMIITKTLTPYQIYYRWMNTYGFLPANFEEVPMI